MREFSIQFFLKVGNLLVTIPVNPEELEITKSIGYDTYANLNKEEILKLQEDKLLELTIESILEKTTSSLSVTNTPYSAEDYLNLFNNWMSNRQIVRVTCSDGQIDFEGYIVEVTTGYQGGTDDYDYSIKIVQERSIELVTNIDYSYSKIDVEYNVLRYTPPTNPTVQTSSNTSSSSGSTSTTTTYTVKKGDTLSGIAKAFYGNSSKWTLIYNANKDKIKNSNLIYPGQVLTIPDANTATISTSSSSKAVSTVNKSSSSKSSSSTKSSSSSNSSKSGYKTIQGVEFWGKSEIYEYDSSYNSKHSPDGWWITYFYRDSGTYCIESSGTAHQGQVVKVGYISSYSSYSSSSTGSGYGGGGGGGSAF